MRCVSAWNAVHPRTRGEHSQFAHGLMQVTGSSPHTRGTLQCSLQCTSRSRFIPAHAGNTHQRDQHGCGQPVHPRTRGEHGSPMTSGGPDIGSSPHTRGTLRRMRRSAGRRRFIPAHAGNTGFLGVRSALRPVHPRTRGEHFGVRCPASFSAGSSPHTRGTRCGRMLGIGHLRFIPAHAGNTLRRRMPRRPLPVHPRTRGEHGTW